MSQYITTAQPQGGVLDMLSNVSKATSAGLTSYSGGSASAPTATQGSSFPWLLVGGAAVLVYILIKRKRK